MCVCVCKYIHLYTQTYTCTYIPTRQVPATTRGAEMSSHMHSSANSVVNGTCVCTCIYIHMYVCMHACIYIINTYPSVYTYIHMYVCIHICMCVCIIYVYIYTYTYVRMNIIEKQIDTPVAYKAQTSSKLHTNEQSNAHKRVVSCVPRPRSAGTKRRGSARKKRRK